MSDAKFSNPNLNENGSIYGAWQTETGDYVIAAKNVNCYLLIGEDNALLIDTAYGEGDLRALVEQLTDLPVIVANTHGHLDHSGGNAFWEHVWMGKGGERTAKEVDSLRHLPHPDYEISFLEDGQVFDLGGIAACRESSSGAYRRRVRAAYLPVGRR